MDTKCKRCGNYYVLRDGYDPTPFCDSCAHEEVNRLTKAVNKTKRRLRTAEMVCQELRLILTARACEPRGQEKLFNFLSAWMGEAPKKIKYATPPQGEKEGESETH